MYVVLIFLKVDKIIFFKLAPGALKRRNIVVMMQ